jgi:formylglycine-generating enzyme required for sulfatase activity
LNGGKGLVNADSPGTYETGWLSSDNAKIDPTDGKLACDPTLATWTSSAGSNENLPINCVDWYEANAFCTWDGAFLPSEAEWEYAGAGGSQQRQYPWGSTEPGITDEFAIYGCNYPGGGSGKCTGFVNIAPVGTPTLGAGLWGQVDMGGELNEWTIDWFAPFVTPCADCASLTAPSTPPNYRVAHGGQFDNTSGDLIPTYRSGIFPASHNFNYGIRCARTP